jgi:hypothetical protein
LIKKFFIDIEACQKIAINQACVQADFEREIIEHFRLWSVPEQDGVGKAMRAIDESVSDPEKLLLSLIG